MRILVFLIFHVGCFNLNAQHIAFDGSGDYRASFNYGLIGENRGIAISFDRGFNDYLSLTSNIGLVAADAEEFIDLMNISGGLRFHFIEVLNYGEPNDLYAGVDLGSATSGVHLGYLRQLTRKLGVQVEVYYGFVDSISNLMDISDENFFKNRPRIYIGLVLNHQKPFWNYW